MEDFEYAPFYETVERVKAYKLFVKELLHFLEEINEDLTA